MFDTQYNKKNNRFFGEYVIHCLHIQYSWSTISIHLELCVWQPQVLQRLLSLKLSFGYH